MSDILLKSLDLGIEAAVVAKEKIDSLVNEISDKRPVNTIKDGNEDDRVKFINIFREALSNIDVASKKDIDELKIAITNLENKISQK
jgi:polyhydroxyalkanoate synthesis regulator phasin